MITSPTESQLSVQERAFLLLPPAAVAVGAFLLHLLPVGEFSYPACPLYASTGVLCPGCGSTRALSALAGGDVLLAFRQNPLTVVLLLFLILIYARYVARTRGWGRSGSSLLRALAAPVRPHPVGIALLGLLIVVYWIVRNFVPLLQPLPV